MLSQTVERYLVVGPPGGLSVNCTSRTIAFTLVVDPTSAYITDQAVRGERSMAEVKSMIFYLALTAIIGTLLSLFSAITVTRTWMLLVAGSRFQNLLKNS